MQEQKLISRRSVWIVVITVLTCFVGATLLGPEVIEWFASPYLPAGTNAFNCAPAIRGSLRGFLWVQFGSLVVGALIGFFFAFKLRKKTPSTAA